MFHVKQSNNFVTVVVKIVVDRMRNFVVELGIVNFMGVGDKMKEYYIAITFTILGCCIGVIVKDIFK